MPKDLRQANRGLGLERLVRLSLQISGQESPPALFHKVPTAWLPLRDGFGRIIAAKVEEKAAVDFLGVYRGWAIAFDCKDTRQKRIRWDRLEPHQAAFLERWELAGGLGFVLVGFAATGGCLLVPWPVWRAGLERWRSGGPAAASEAELAEAGACAVGPGQGGRVPLDILAAIERFLPVGRRKRAKMAEVV